MTPAPPPKPPAKSNNKRTLAVGCGIAAAIFGVLGIICLVALTRFFSGETGGAVVEILGQMKEGLTAPGVKELQEAGCQLALVIDEADLQNGLNRRFDAGLEEAAHAMTVTCTVTGGHEAPACAELAKVYVRAVGGRALGPVTVLVTTGNTENCQQKFDATGSPQTP